MDSNYQYPPYNIALEDILRSSPSQQDSWFITYCNQPAVIIGRNQDALAETSISGLASGIPIFRRTTGGGAVYHDQGNLNWAFIQKGNLENRSQLVSLIIKGLRSLGLDVSEGARGGLYINAHKIGGTASSVSKGRLLFHGTLLVNSDLARLHACLAAESGAYRQSVSTGAAPQKGIPSVPSPVANISSFLPNISMPELKGALRRTLEQGNLLANDYSTSEIDTTLIKSTAVAYEDPCWIYGRLESHRARKDYHESARDFRQFSHPVGRCSPGIVHYH